MAKLRPSLRFIPFGSWINDITENEKQETKDPKPAYTPWPYGRANDSAGSDQRVERLGNDDQTLGKQNIELVGVGTRHGSCIHQLHQIAGYRDRVVF